MGVPGLWDILRPSGQTRSLTELAVVEGFEANKSGLRGFRIGIDASIWFFHAEYGKEGENPELRTLFFRCATLMHAPFLPLFVFDGPKRPDFKRGKRISKSNNALVNGMKAIIEAFGYEWRMAPAEAEAELAYLNRIGLIDGILSDDVDNFLFGALTVIRNQSNTLSGNRSNPVLNAEGKDDKQHTKIYRLQDIQSHEDIGLTRGGMILIGLMRGGDYHQEGVVGCGPVIAHGLARCGFGDQLCGAANRLSRDELPAFLDNWRHALREELRTNARGFVGRKHTKLAASISDAFPDINVLLSYTHPITTESMGRTQNNLKLTWSRDPDLTRLARICEQFFEWGFKELIIKRFRTIIWPGTVLRVLRRGALQQEKVLSASAALPQGSPSKIIARHFSSIKLDSDDENTELDSARQFIIKIHSTRNHVSTDGILEYRLEIDPATFVQVAEAGITGDRRPEDQNEWSSDEQEDEDEEGGKKKGEKRNPPDPFSHLRVWVPAAMVRLVEPDIVAKFEAAQERKLAKKAGKTEAGTKATTAGSDAENIPLPKPRKKATRSKAMPKVSK
ncbi:PIN domain-like protein, partial [Fistulina hepatica ATCC 64428]